MVRVVAAKVTELNFINGLETMREIFECNDRMAGGRVGPVVSAPISINMVLFAKIKLLTFPGAINMRHLMKVPLL